jgi:hypothetical protein
LRPERALALFGLAGCLAAPSPADEPPASADATTPAVAGRQSVDTRTDVDTTNLRALPRPADAWSVLREVPGVVVDRVNVGGSDTALQSLLVSHGDPGTGATWTLDGVDVTDPAALGTALVYPPFDALETIGAQSGGTDVRARTPGVQVALALRAPSERFSGGFDARFAHDALQSENLPDDLRGRTFYRSRTEEVLDLAAEAGGPVGRRLWLWGSASRYALRQETFTEHEERLRTATLAGRARLRLGSGTSSLLLLRGEKTHEDRDPTLQAAPEARWRQSGPTWIASLRDERTVGAFRLASQVAWVDGGFRLAPQGGTVESAFQDVSGVSRRSFALVDTERRRAQAGVEATVSRAFAGFRHELLLGTGYRRMGVSTVQKWPGNSTRGLESGGVFFRAFRLTGFALAYRDLDAESVHDQWELYAQDTARRGRLAVTLGARLDRLAGHGLASAVGANPVAPEDLPAVAFEGSPERFTWLDVLPRVGLSYDVAGHGRLLASVRYAAYGAPLGSAEVAYDDPLAELASATWYWIDRNGDATVTADELDTVRGRLGTSGLDPADPGAPVGLHRIDPGLRAPRTQEVAGGLAWTPGAGLALSVEMSYRRLTDALWRPLRGVSSTDYAATGAVSGELFGTAYQRVYFAPASTSQLAPGYGRQLENREGYRQDAVTVSAAASGRIAGRVDWRAWGAFMDGWERFLDRDLAVQDPTPLEAAPLQDFGRIVVRPGGLGRDDLFVNARWMAGGSVLARLPWSLEASVVVNARDGFPIPYFQVGNTGDPTSAAKNVLVSPAIDTYRLPSLVLADARLARGFPLGPGRLTVALDAFNVANAATKLQVARDVELAAFDRTREIVRPRILRLGFSWRF